MPSSENDLLFDNNNNNENNNNNNNNNVMISIFIKILVYDSEMGKDFVNRFFEEN